MWWSKKEPIKPKPKITMPDFNLPTTCVWCSGNIKVKPDWQHPYWIHCPICDRVIWVVRSGIITLKGEDV